MIRFSNFEHLQDHLVKAALGQVPVPISKENLAKAYAHFRGARAKETVLRLTSRLDILLNLVPQAKEILPRITELDLGRMHTFIEENALHEFTFNLNSAQEVRQELMALRDEQYRLIAKVFRNPDQVLTALHSTTKKEWMSQLHSQPKSQVLLATSAQLSSEQFFTNQMHLAFMEIEPETYGILNPEAEQYYFGIGRLYRKELHLRKLMRQLEQQEAQNKPAPTQIIKEQGIKENARLAEKVTTAPDVVSNAHSEKERFQPSPKKAHYTPPQKQQSAREQSPEHDSRVKTTEGSERQPKMVYKPKETDKNQHNSAQSTQKQPQTSAENNAESKRGTPVELPEIQQPKKPRHALSTHTEKRKLSTNLQDIPADSNSRLADALSAEFGGSISLSSEQAEALINSAKSLVFGNDSAHEESDNDGFFLHKSKPLPQKKKMTLETINLSKK